MPKLVVFAACQKAIISDQDETLSLISLLENISIPVPEGTQAPSALSAPIRWDIVTYWRSEAEDGGRKFEQKTQLVLPDESIKFETILKFNLDNTTARNIVNVAGFPVGISGNCHLQLWVRDIDKNEEYQLACDYMLTVTHEVAPAIADLDIPDESNGT